MALDLGDELAWAWLLQHGDAGCLCVLHRNRADAAERLEAWAARLKSANRLDPGQSIDGRSIRSAPVRPAGALGRDVVARRTLLAGPAGGFISATGEDLYPSCWSARVAAEVADQALQSAHVQDALGDYRGQWGGDLGEYLLGPQQNLKFLLPLVYKNPVMTDRLAHSAFRGTSLVK
jgi:flavin-dependent dehydrogenase